MKQKPYRALLMLGMIIFMPSIGFARSYGDSIVMNRVWNYHLQLRQDVNGQECNMYMTYTLQTKRRNHILRYIPTMKGIARGEREFMGEAYGKLKFRDKFDYDFVVEAERSTIQRHRRPIPALFENLMPYVYNEHFYKDRLLSPFHRKNRRFYKYSVTHLSDSTAQVMFRPRVGNTQLVEGQAIVSSTTGCIHSLTFKGEFDMLWFTTSVEMDSDNPYGQPKINNTKASFKCIGNHVEADFTYHYNMPHVVADSIYQILKHEQDSVDWAQAQADTVVEKHHWYDGIKHFAWDELSDSTRFSSGKAYVGISPLFNPMYMSYSSSKGLSLKLMLYAKYKWDDRRFLIFDPSFGYTIKQNQFYYTLPLTMTYNSNRNGRVGFIWANGNHISNGKLEETFNDRVGHDTISMPEFRDQYFILYNNIAIFNWMQFTAGLNYHIRKAIGQHDQLQQAGLQTAYRSFAPYLTILLMPWQDRGPVLSGNYERSILNVLGSDLNYARYEFDAQYKLKIRGMRRLNLRAGAGFYTLRNTNYFVDFANFRDNNLPTGWDDDWTGQFQLLDSRLYNESNYYVRGHISYETPLLALAWVPFVGSFIESERLYFSLLNIERIRGYCEVGYGFKCKFFSTAFFASFLDARYDSFECKFTIELFNRW